MNEQQYERIVLSEDVQKIIREISHVNKLPYDDLKRKFEPRIKISEKLGMAGWTINSEKTPVYAQDWLEIIESKGESAIADLFSEDDINDILELLMRHYNTIPELGYMRGAIENYRAERFTESAMFLLGVLDHRVSELKPNSYSKKKRQCEDGFRIEGENAFQNHSKRPAFRQFVICDYIPSFSKYALRLFDDGNYSFEKGIEPPYLNRNWLMHGRMTRKVQKFECIQLFNALKTLIDIENMICEDVKNGQT